MLADLAYIFGWSLSELMQMSLEDISKWHVEAIAIHNKVNGHG